MIALLDLPNQEVKLWFELYKKGSRFQLKSEETSNFIKRKMKTRNS